MPSLSIFERTNLVEMRFGVLCWLAFGLVTCAASQQAVPGAVRASSEEIQQLARLLTGTFTSAAQATADSTFFDISLTMQPVWEQDEAVCWLYVEQAVTARLREPYRQRIYRLSQLPDGRFESRVYELPDPAAFIHAWERPAVFEELSTDELLLRRGCAVYLEKRKDGCYHGATAPNACESTLYGARYATSEVTICPGKITSWDRGWNAAGEQVWGAEKGGYVFLEQ
jgi:CpeT protein